ncbi:MAG: potassium-transporting ATPase subunit KdpA [Candidatus Schekmanbacteria bacterium]|nr:potassium-transporting ATPase subunit KdpA [Candidatus Schekmanbacteria bacterium]
MTFIGFLQLALFVALLTALTRPLGAYLGRVLDGGATPLDRLLRPLERLIYRSAAIDPAREQSWPEYASALLALSLVTLLFTYALLRLQDVLPLNPSPDALGTPLTPDLAFNTAASFTTNTNWQSYSGEDTMSYLSQMVALSLHNFLSAAAGIAVAAALVRGITRDRSRGIGNFWVDVVRITLYLLLPLSLPYALFLVSQGTIQSFGEYVTAAPLEGHGAAATQLIPRGPMASQVAIKMLGTNGGGFTGANAAFPFENPSPLTNFVQMLSIFAISSGLIHYFGCTARARAHAWTLWAVCLVLFLAGATALWWAEAAGNPQFHALGVDPADGNLEGKEVRFGVFSSALFATLTTDASCGAVNAMHDSLTPLGGLVALFNIQAGGVIFGGVGVGLYGLLLFVILAIFIAGLMVGRTPEYLGKKIEAFDVKMATLAILVTAFGILGFSGWAAASTWGTSQLGNAGPHGLTEILYAFSSAVGNNGSAFAGLRTSTPWWNLTLGLAMLFGRFFVIVPVLALAGSLAGKKRVPSGAGTFPTAGLTFGILLAGVIIIVGALTFVPALVLGPAEEHFLMHAGRQF